MLYTNYGRPIKHSSIEIQNFLGWDRQINWEKISGVFGVF